MRGSLDYNQEANGEGRFRPALRARFSLHQGMEAKASDGCAVNAAADPSGSRAIDFSELMEKYAEVNFAHGKSSGEDRAAACLPIAVRNFGNAGSPCALSGSNNDVLAEFAPPAEKSFGASELLKLEPAEWRDITDKILHLKDTPDSLEGSVPSGTAMCKFIKDESEPSLIMEPPQPPHRAGDFELASAVEPLAVPEDSAALLAAAAGQQLGVDSSTNFLVDLNLPNSADPASFPQLRGDSRLVPAAKAMLNLDVVNAPSPQHLLMCKNEGGRWQNSPADFWSQSAVLSEEQHGQSGYSGPDALNGSGFGQRAATYCAFPRVPPQRMCVICGDEASGCHYGVLTCGSCKVFFKRAVEGHHNYLCAGRNDCIVDKIRRKNCPACRLRKCYQAGMMLGGRKLKRFGVLKAMGLSPSLMFPSPLALTAEGHALASMPCFPGIRDLQLSPQIISILESIEPEIVYSGYDNSQPELPHLLLNSLNRLCERQLLWIVRWSKSLPGFRNLHINDQMTLIQYSWMNLMVFALGWRSFQNVTTDYLYFAPDLVLSQDRMRRSPIFDLCLAMQYIPQEFANLQVTREEFLCMKALMLLNTVPLEGLKSQSQFDEMRQSYIRELTKAIQMKEKGVVGSSQRFYHLTKLMDSMHEIVKKVNLYCLSTFIQADAMKVEFPEMMTEVISSQLPKVLAGMVRPLLFHGK
ncbi:progesterone receptor [Colossoma macropomum]|uniref:progesterone receptor n=1 Tax=Colossoma macropomum TaxID=42526 RepID=UPI001864CC05|nr:progesterone receptor [Colossoma macropomum]